MIDGLDVHVVRKPIRNMYLRIKPPEGRVEISAPVRMAVSLSKIEPPHIKDSLETADDVDDFLDAYRRELMAAIENGKKILL